MFATAHALSFSSAYLSRIYCGKKSILFLPQEGKGEKNTRITRSLHSARTGGDIIPPKPKRLTLQVIKDATRSSYMYILLLLLRLRFKTYVQQRECSRVAGYLRKKKQMHGFPCHLLGSAKQKTFPFFLEPTRRSSMHRAPPRCSAGIQTCVVMHPRPPCFPRSRKREKEPSAAGEQHA